MIYFISGLLFCALFFSVFLNYLLYKQFKKKVSKQDIEDYLLDNFLEDF